MPYKVLNKYYQIIKVIDTGGYSIVYYAYNKKLANFVAIKEFIPSQLNLRTENNQTNIEFKSTNDERLFNYYKQSFVNEINILNKINHNNIIKILDYFEENGTMYFVTPYEVGQSLSDYMYQQFKNKKNIDEQNLIRITTDLIKSVQALHKHNILHLDLKPKNIWLRPNNEVLLLDFGTAKLENQEKLSNAFTNGFAGIEFYASRVSSMIKNDKNKALNKKEIQIFESAKEKINRTQNNKIGTWSDLYAIGATIYTLLTFKIPPNSWELYYFDKQINTQYLEGQYNLKLIDIINTLCTHDIKIRKECDLQNILNILRNIVPFKQKNFVLSNIIAKKPPYVISIS